MNTTEYDPKDRLDGAQAIADFLGMSLRRTFYVLEKGHVPAGKVGTVWTASKRRLAEHMAAVVNGEERAAK